MKQAILPLTISIFIFSLASCSFTPGSGGPPSPTPTSSSVPPSDYEPQPADSKLKRDRVSLELENSSIVLMESDPVQVSVLLNGSLSDPCHQLRVVVNPALTEKQVNLDVYSVFDPKLACIMVIKPFTATIPLGSFPTGHYKVLVNGDLLGEFDS